MGITFMEVLEDEIFRDAEIRAGKEGLRRQIGRVSVFDCPYHEDMMEEGVIEEGDLFLSCLEQFPPEEAGMERFIRGLIQYKAAGLMVVSSGRTDLLTEEVLQLCGRNEFPVLVVRRSNSYAQIMSVVNRYIAAGSANSLRLQKLRRIRDGGLSEKENVELLHSINPGIQSNITVLSVKGSLRSPLFSTELWSQCEDGGKDIAARGEALVFILSDEDARQLRQRAEAVSVQLKDKFSDYVMGFSRIYAKQEISRALRESRVAVETAAAQGVARYTYDPLNSLQLLYALRGSQEARDFYESYRERIAGKTSGEMLPELLHTIEAYVESAGDFRRTAEKISQHENTVRYRINRVKNALGMEHDTVRFHETISIAARCKLLFEKQD